MKQAPSVMFIEMAMESLRQTDHLRASTLKEFNSLGAQRKGEIIESCGGDPLTAGYLLGLETARALLATMPAAIKAGVSI